MTTKHSALTILLFSATFTISPVKAVAQDSEGAFHSKVVGAEAFVDFNKQSGEKGVFSTDGPTVTIETEIPTKHLLPLSVQDSIKLRTSLTVMFNEAFRVDQSKFEAPLLHGKTDWNYFFREAKIILDIDPKTNSPIATIIAGVQDLESGAFDTHMPIPDNEALRGLTRVRSAHAIQVQLNSKVFDSLSVAVFNTGAGHPETMGDNIQAHAPGATVMFSKNLSERLKITSALTRISFPEKSEIRFNTGVAYENKEKGYTVFFDHVYFPNKGNLLYPDSTAAWTLGVIKQINSKHFLTAETTNVNNGAYREMALGYAYSISDRTSIRVGIRKSTQGTKIESRLAYSFGAK